MCFKPEKLASKVKIICYFGDTLYLSMVTYTHSTWAIVVMQEYNPSSI